MIYKDGARPADRKERRLNFEPCPPEGSGVHDWTINAVARCRADGLSLDESLRWVMERSNRSKGAEKEISNLYKSSNVPIGGSSDFKPQSPIPKPLRFVHRPQPAFIAKKNEDGDVEDMIRFAEHVFRGSETIFISGGLSHDKFQGKGWQVWDAIDLLKNHPDAEEMFGNRKDGLYIKCNPINPDWRAVTGKENRSAPKAQFQLPNGEIASDVSDFRHCLVEFDTGSLAQQIAVIERANLPIKAMCQSGHKSIHAIVAIDADQDFALYKSRTELVVRAVNCAAKALGYQDEIKIDKVQDAVRWTRFAGARRRCDKKGNPLGDDGKGVIQKLLALFDAEWIDPEEVDEDADALLACAADHQKAFSADLNYPPQIIDGFIRPGDVASLTAPSKVGKTWELIRMASAIASGGEWMGMQCHPHNVVYLNFELHEYDMHMRMRRVLPSNIQAQKRFLTFNLRGMKGDTETMLAAFERLIEKKRIIASIIIVDPIYRFYGDADENSNTDISNLLLRIQKFASNTGMAVVFAHHHAKGRSRPDTMTSGEQQSGAGAFTRSYDANINLGRIPSSLKDMYDPEEHMIIEFDLRAFPRKAPMIVKWNEIDCEFEIVESGDVDLAREVIKEEKKQERERKASEKKSERQNKVLDFISESGEADIEDIMELLGLSRNHARDNMINLERDGMLESRRAKHGKKVWFLAH